MTINILAIPNEIFIHHIKPNLNVKDISSLCLVSKYYYKLLKFGINPRNIIDKLFYKINKKFYKKMNESVLYHNYIFDSRKIKDYNYEHYNIYTHYKDNNLIIDIAIYQDSTKEINTLRVFSKIMKELGFMRINVAVIGFSEYVRYTFVKKNVKLTNNKTLHNILTKMFFMMMENGLEEQVTYPNNHCIKREVGFPGVFYDIDYVKLLKKYYKFNNEITNILGTYMNINYRELLSTN